MTGTEVYAPFTSAEPAAQSPPAIASPATKKSSPTILIPVAIVLALIALAVVKSSGTSKPKSYDTALELAADLQSHGLCDDHTEMPGVWGDTEAGCKAHGQGMNVFVNTPGSGVASILAELEQSSADFSFDHAPVVGPNWVVSTIASNPSETDTMKEVQRAKTWTTRRPEDRRLHLAGLRNEERSLWR